MYEGQSYIRLFSTPGVLVIGRCNSIPIILDANFNLVEEICRWIIYLASRGNELSTIISYTDAILDFLRSLCACKSTWNVLGWQTVTDGVLNSYYCSTKTKTSVETANMYLSRIMLFYRWALSRNLIFHLPWEVKKINPTDRSETIEYYAAGSVIYTDSIREHISPKSVEAYSPAEEKKIFSFLNKRDRLIAKWAKLTGARRFEIAAINLTDFRAIDMNGGGVLLLPVTKSGSPEEVYVPSRLCAETEQYIFFERALCILAAKERAVKNNVAFIEPEALFLNKDGDRIQAGRISKNWKDALKKSGVMRGKFHWNRHGFATDLLKELQILQKEIPNLNIEKTLQGAVRHANVTTTKRFYIAAQEHNRAAIKRAMDRRAEQSSWD